MNNFPSKETVERLRREYPAGTRVELIAMYDPYSKLKPGDRAMVRGVDDAGNILCKWDCGSTLSLIPGVDRFRIAGAFTEKIREQILAVRATGKANMFDISTVQRIAYENGFYELVDYLETDRTAYARFILTGE